MSTLIRRVPSPLKDIYGPPTGLRIETPVEECAESKKFYDLLLNALIDSKTKPSQKSPLMIRSSPTNW